MSRLTIHPTTKKQLDLLTRELPQSLLFSGQSGVGLLTIARQIAGENIAGEIHPQDSKEQTDNENGTITVEMIRRLYEQTRARYTKRQIIIVDNAERMSRGAQSAFLKLLEEPNGHIYFILTSHHPQLLLPTIRSRVQQLAVNPITPEQTKSFITTLEIGEGIKHTQLEFIAAGLPAELTRLAGDDEYFTQRAVIIGDARDFLQSDPYTKLIIIQKYKANRPGALQLVDSAMHLLRRTLSSQPQQTLVTQLDQLLIIKERISANHNIPLQLATFVL